MSEGEEAWRIDRKRIIPHEREQSRGKQGGKKRRTSWYLGFSLSRSLSLVRIFAATTSSRIYRAPFCPRVCQSPRSIDIYKILGNAVRFVGYYYLFGGLIRWRSDIFSLFFLVLGGVLQAYPGMMPYKRSAGDKTSANMAAVYQQHQQSAANASHAAMTAAAAYQAQALMQLQQQPYGVPVSCEYSSTTTSNAVTNAATTTTAGLVATAVTTTCSSNSLTPSSSTTNTGLLIAASNSSYPTQQPSSSSSSSSSTTTLTATTTTTNSPLLLNPIASSASSSSSLPSSALSASSVGGGGSSNNNNNNNKISGGAGLLQPPALASLSLALTNGNAAAYEAATLAALTNFAKREESERAAAAAIAAAEAEALEQEAEEALSRGSLCIGSGISSCSSSSTSTNVISNSSAHYPLPLAATAVTTVGGIKRPRSPANSQQTQVSSLVSPFLASSNSPGLLSYAPTSSSSSSSAAATAAAAAAMHYSALQPQTALAYTGVSLNKQQQQHLAQQQQQQQHHQSQQQLAVSASVASGSASFPIPSMAALQQYQQYLNPYYSLVGAAQAQQQAAATQTAFANSYGNPFAGSGHLLNSQALGLALSQHGLQAGQSPQAAVAAAQVQAQQQLAALQQSMQQNPGLMAAAAAAAAAAQSGVAGYHPHLSGSAGANASSPAGALGMYAAAAAAGNPFSSLAHFNQQQMMHSQYMQTLNGQAAAAAAAMGRGGGIVPGVSGVPNPAAAAAAAAAAAMANAGLQPYKKMRTIWAEFH